MFIPRTLADTNPRPGGGALARAVLVAMLLAVPLFLILSANISLGQASLEVNQVADRDIRAPFSAEFVSASQTQQARDDAEAQVTPRTIQLLPAVDNLSRQLGLYDRLVSRVSRVLVQRVEEGWTIAQTAERLRQQVVELSLSQADLIADMTVPEWEEVAAAGRSVLETVLADQITEEDVSDVRREVRDLITSELTDEERRMVGTLAATFVTPTHAVSDELTRQAQQEARDAVEPRRVQVRQNQVIVADGDVIDAADHEALTALGLTRPRVDGGIVAANALIATLLAGMVVAFLWRFDPEIWHRNRSLLLFILALVASAVAIRIAADRTLWAFIVPTTATVLLIGILLGASAGAGMAVALAVFAGVANSNALAPGVFVLGGGVVALLAIVKAERLNAFVRAGALLAVTNFAVLLAFSLLEQRDLAAILQLSVAGVANAILSVLLAVGSFAMLGNVFGIMTMFQLLELANPSNRLLRRLLLETPGTYHHSVMVGNLAERAAETIGADPLLARVAAYYHDIGKMKNPLAFIENQGGAHNIHDDLTPETSSRIIASHIRDGIDLGYEHGLPVPIIGFIPQHHGTSVMSYFHGRALDAVGGDERLARPDAFRYPGPKPQTREAAILMLADGVEASVRSLDEKDEPSIRSMVDRIVDARVDDGQLDDADLTLKNIAQIKEAFVQQLLGMYHSRIKYPDNVVPMEQHRERA